MGSVGRSLPEHSLLDAAGKCIFLETHVTREPCLPLGKGRRKGHILQDEQGTKVGVFPRGAWTGRAEGAEEAGRRATAESHRATSLHTPRRLSAASREEGHLYRPLVLCLSRSCLGESSSGTVMSQMLGSGENHVPRSL